MHFIEPRHIYAAFLLGLGFVSGTTACTPATPQAQPTEDMVSAKEHAQNLWIMNADGTESRPLTETKADSIRLFHPRWSPDGSQILFISNQKIPVKQVYYEGEDFVWLMNADGTKARPIFNSLPVARADWYPGGKRILVGAREERDVLPSWWTVDLPSMRVKPLQGPRMKIPGAQLAPDGSHLAYRKNYVGKERDEFDLPKIESLNLWIARTNGQAARSLTRFRNNENVFNFDWSPNGGQLAFEARSFPGPLNIWVVSTRGTGLRTLTPSQGDCRNPAWSPDGKSIAYDLDKKNIWVVNVDGGSPRALTQLQGVNEHAVWSPDGSAIAFEGDGAIWVVSADGKEVKRLTDGKSERVKNISPRWSPDGRKILYVSSRPVK